MLPEIFLIVTLEKKNIKSTIHDLIELLVFTGNLILTFRKLTVESLHQSKECNTLVPSLMSVHRGKRNFDSCGR